MSDPLTAAREALAAFDLHTRFIVAQRLSGKMKAAPMNRRLTDAEKHLRAALARVDELTAEVERLRGLLREAVEASDAMLFSGFIRVDAGDRMTARARMANVASYPTLAEVKKP